MSPVQIGDASPQDQPTVYERLDRMKELARQAREAIERAQAALRAGGAK